MLDEEIFNMMRNTILLFKHEVAKNKKLANFVETLENATIEEIEAAKFPKWIRKELVLRKRLMNSTFRGSNSGAPVDVPEWCEALRGQRVIDGFLPPVEGEIRRWMGGDVFIHVDRGNLLELKADRLIFFPTTGGVWLDTAFSSLVDPRLYTATVVKKNTNRTVYSEMHKEELLRLYSNAPTMMTIEAPNNPSLSPTRLDLAKKGVTIF
jgi:hypothetical protein